MDRKRHPDSVLTKLEEILKSKALILGIGNTLRGDDAFGSALAKDIKGKVRLNVLDAGSAPENFLGTILRERPEAVLMIDAVDFGGEAAQMRLLDLKKVKTKNFFLTHNPSPLMLLEFLKSGMKAKFYLLAIQPQRIGFGEDLSFRMQERLEELKLWFLKMYPINAQ